MVGSSGLSRSNRYREATVVRPSITAGRELLRSDEIALGVVTMRQLDVGIGDAVQVASTVTSSYSTTMTVVGTTVINDTYEGSPGLGAVVTQEWLAQAAPEASTPDPYVARLEPDADRAAFKAAIEREFGATVNAPVEQTAIRNVNRIRSLPLALAAMVGVLAISSLAHAVVLSTRRHRGQLAILRTLGFSSQSGRIRRALAGDGARLGCRGHRAPPWRRRRTVGWRAVAEQLGVASEPEVPLLGIVAAAAAVVVIAHLVAVIPAWRCDPAAPGGGVPGRASVPQATRVRTRQRAGGGSEQEAAAVERGAGRSPRTADAHRRPDRGTRRGSPACHRSPRAAPTRRSRRGRVRHRVLRR